MHFMCLISAFLGTIDVWFKYTTKKRGKHGSIIYSQHAFNNIHIQNSLQFCDHFENCFPPTRKPQCCTSLVPGCFPPLSGKSALGTTLSATRLKTYSHWYSTGTGLAWNMNCFKFDNNSLSNSKQCKSRLIMITLPLSWVTKT